MPKTITTLFKVFTFFNMKNAAFFNIKMQSSERSLEGLRKFAELSILTIS